MIGSSVYSKLTSLNITGLNTSKGLVRVYPNYIRMTDKNLLAGSQVVYDCENFETEPSMDGADQLPTIDVKIVAVGETYDEADAIAQQLKVLDSTAGMWGATKVVGCFLTEVSEDHFVDTDLETILYFIKELVFKVHFQQ